MLQFSSRRVAGLSAIPRASAAGSPLRAADNNNKNSGSGSPTQQPNSLLDIIKRSNTQGGASTKPASGPLANISTLLRQLSGNKKAAPTGQAPASTSGQGATGQGATGQQQQQQRPVSDARSNEILHKVLHTLKSRTSDTPTQQSKSEIQRQRDRREFGEGSRRPPPRQGGPGGFQQRPGGPQQRQGGPQQQQGFRPRYGPLDFRNTSARKDKDVEIPPGEEAEQEDDGAQKKRMRRAYYDKEEKLASRPAYVRRPERRDGKPQDEAGGLAGYRKVRSAEEKERLYNYFKQKRAKNIENMRDEYAPESGRASEDIDGLDSVARAERDLRRQLSAQKEAEERARFMADDSQDMEQARREMEREEMGSFKSMMRGRRRPTDMLEATWDDEEGALREDKEDEEDPDEEEVAFFDEEGEEEGDEEEEPLFDDDRMVQEARMFQDLYREDYMEMASEFFENGDPGPVPEFFDELDLEERYTDIEDSENLPIRLPVESQIDAWMPLLGMYHMTKLRADVARFREVQAGMDELYDTVTQDQVSLYIQWKFLYTLCIKSQLPRVEIYLKHAEKALKKQQARHDKRISAHKAALAKLDEMQAKTPRVVPDFAQPPPFINQRWVDRHGYDPTKYLHSVFENHLYIPIRPMSRERAEKLQELWMALSRNGSYTSREKVSLIKRLNQTFSKAHDIRVDWVPPPKENPLPGWSDENYAPNSLFKLPQTEESMAEWIKSGEANKFWNSIPIVEEDRESFGVAS